jgi:hypothetical protein
MLFVVKRSTYFLAPEFCRIRLSKQTLAAAEDVDNDNDDDTAAAGGVGHKRLATQRLTQRREE